MCVVFFSVYTMLLLLPQLLLPLPPPLLVLLLLPALPLNMADKFALLRSIAVPSTAVGKLQTQQQQH